MLYFIEEFIRKSNQDIYYERSTNRQFPEKKRIKITVDSVINRVIIIDIDVYSFHTQNDKDSFKGISHQIFDLDEFPFLKLIHQTCFFSQEIVRFSFSSPT